MSRAPHLTSIKGYAPDFVARVLDLARASPGRPPVFGIAGLQGSGKSTLARQLVDAGQAQGLAVTALSLDDFYLGPRERQRLARAVHPLLATRGPPGTHDVALACATLDALRGLADGGAITLPRFDKARDRRLPPARWPRVTQRPDVIVFEGWCLGVPPEASEALAAPVNALERDEDPGGPWGGHGNSAWALSGPRWGGVDGRFFLRGRGFGVVRAWRAEAEAGPAGARPHVDIARFVLFFERISRQALATLPHVADHVIHLDAARQPRD